MKDGMGTKVWPNGMRYEGQFRNAKMNGQGKLFKPNGDVYDGQWVDDKLYGMGTWIGHDSTKYVG